MRYQTVPYIYNYDNHTKIFDKPKILFHQKKRDSTWPNILPPRSML